ncbi:hypothetical protein HDU96_006581 [Phlyctochytrium bullatum]|nr:hypothetical protein HDU96_006581 [Phlyctochytrium bullatum]
MDDTGNSTDMSTVRATRAAVATTTATATNIVIKATLPVSLPNNIRLPPGISLQDLPAAVNADVIAMLEKLEFTPNANNSGYMCFMDPNSPVGYVIEPSLGHKCKTGFYCPFIDPNDTRNQTLPVVCPPLPACAQIRTYGSPCPAQGLFEPVICKQGYYCPDQLQQIKCPAGHFCPSGSLAPKPCSWMSRCPPGSISQLQYGPVVVAVVIDLIFIAFVLIQRYTAASRKKKELLRAKEAKEAKETKHGDVPANGSLGRLSGSGPRLHAYRTSPSPAYRAGSGEASPFMKMLGINSPVLRSSGKSSRLSSRATSPSRSGTLSLGRENKGSAEDSKKIAARMSLLASPSAGGGAGSTPASAVKAGMSPSDGYLSATGAHVSTVNSSPLNLGLTDVSRKPSQALVPSIIQSAAAILGSGRNSTSSQRGDLEAARKRSISSPVTSANSTDPYMAQPIYPPGTAAAQYEEQYPYPGLGEDGMPNADPAAPMNDSLNPPRPWFGKRTWSGVSWTEAIERTGPQRRWGGSSDPRLHNTPSYGSDGVSTTSSSSASAPNGVASTSIAMPSDAKHATADGQRKHAKATTSLDRAKRSSVIRSLFGWLGTPTQQHDGNGAPVVGPEMVEAGRYQTSAGRDVQVARPDQLASANDVEFLISTESGPAAAAAQPTSPASPADEDGGALMMMARNGVEGPGSPAACGSSMIQMYTLADEADREASTSGKAIADESAPASAEQDEKKKKRSSGMSQSRSTLVTFDGEEGVVSNGRTSAEAAMADPLLPTAHVEQESEGSEARHNAARQLPPPLQIAKPNTALTPATGAASTAASARGISFAAEVQDIISNVFTETDMARLVSSWQKGLKVAPNIRMEFTFNNLCVKLPTGREVLKSVSGNLRSGRMTAIMGPSGSGKTTLMNVLLGKVKHTSGDIQINNRTSDPTLYRKVIGYVPQEDTMLRELTVREVLLHSGRVRLPPTWTEAEVEEHVDNVIGILGLGYVSDSIIGDERDRGVSGGQRKRVNVGIELAAVPLALLLDEPTSGLDATSALLLISLLSSITKYAGLTTVAILHQPRPEVFHLFDDVIMLAPSGQVAYAGPVNCVRPYFESLGFEMSSSGNVADQAMDILCGAAILKRKPDGIGSLGRALSAYEISKVWERRRKSLKRKAKKSEAQQVSSVVDSVAVSKSSKRDGKMSSTPATSAAATTADKSVTSMSVQAGGDSDHIGTVTATDAADSTNVASASVVPASTAVVLMDGHCEAAHDAAVVAEAERIFYSNIANLVKNRGASFLQQFLYCHQRSLIQQSRRLSALTLEIFVAMFAGLLMGISLQGVDELYRGTYRDGYVTFSPANQDWVGLYGLLIGIAVAMAGAPAGVKVFGEEKTVYWREASSGHSRGAYFLGKSTATIYRFIVSSLHFAAVYYVFAKPVISFGVQYLIILLSFWGIYGLACIVSMVVRRENAPLLAVVSGLFAAVFCGFGPNLNQAAQWKLLWLWELSFNKWACEAHYASVLMHYKHVFDTEKSAKFFGYALDQVNFDFVMIFVIGIFLRIVAFILLVMLNRDKQK